MPGRLAMARPRLSARPAPTGSPVGLATMAPAMAEAGNYYRWLAELIAPAVGRRVLDVGGGRGSLLAHFLDRERLFALDLGPDAVAYLERAFAAHPHLEARCGDVTEPGLQALYRREGVDTILCTNVLEHIDDDRAVLGAFAAILAPARGRLALQVPAHPWLYGSLDEAAGHYRRYTRRELRGKLETAGFVVESLRSVNALAIPGWWWAGRVRRQGLADDACNAQVRLYDRWLIPVARRLEAILAPPLGLSLLALGRAGTCAPAPGY